MRIVNGKEFLAINKPVVYQEYYSEFDWGTPRIKLENCGKDDFFYNQLFEQDVMTNDFVPQNTVDYLSLIERSAKTGEHFVRNYDSVERDGSCVKETDKFVVYDNADLKAMILTIINKVMKGENHEEWRK